MPRLFVGLSLPKIVRTDCAHLRSNMTGAHWVDPDTYHITLCFIGEVEGSTMIDLIQALACLQSQVINLHLGGVDVLSKKSNLSGTLVALVSPTTALLALQKKVNAVLWRADLSTKKASFKPHITLARFKQALPDQLGAWLKDYALYKTAPFEICCFHLYSSHRNLKKTHYKQEWTGTLLSHAL